MQTDKTSQRPSMPISQNDGAKKAASAQKLTGTQKAGVAKIQHGQRGLQKTAGASVASVGLKGHRSFKQLVDALSPLLDDKGKPFIFKDGRTLDCFDGLLGRQLEVNPDIAEKALIQVKNFVKGLTPTEEMTLVVPAVQSQQASGGSKLDTLTENFPEAFSEVSPNMLGLMAKEPSVGHDTLVRILNKVVMHFQDPQTPSAGKSLDTHFQRLMGVALGGRTATEHALANAARGSLPTEKENPHLNGKVVLKAHAKACADKAAEKASADSAKPDSAPVKKKAWQLRREAQAKSFQSKFGETKPAEPKTETSQTSEPKVDWRTRRKLDSQARQNLISKEFSAATNRADAISNTSGTEPTHEEARQTLQILGNTTMDNRPKAEQLTAFFSRPNAGKVLSDVLGTNEQSITQFFGFEMKPLFGLSHERARQGRLAQLVPHLSNEQLSIALNTHGFNALLRDRTRGDGGHAKNITRALSEEQFNFVLNQVQQSSPNTAYELKQYRALQD